MRSNLVARMVHSKDAQDVRQDIAIAVAGREYYDEKPLRELVCMLRDARSAMKNNRAYPGHPDRIVEAIHRKQMKGKK